MHSVLNSLLLNWYYVDLFVVVVLMVLRVLQSHFGGACLLVRAGRGCHGLGSYRYGYTEYGTFGERKPKDQQVI